jgi:uncharacterized membrane protein
MAENNGESRKVPDSASLTGEARPRFAALSVLLAAIFFDASLTPSMVPRDPVMQGLVAGVSAAVGFEIGNALRWLWRFIQLPTPSSRLRRLLQISGFALALAIVVYALWNAASWQNTTRSIMGLDAVSSSQPKTIIIVSLFVFFAIWLVLRLLGIALRRVERLLGRFLPRRVAVVVGFVLVLWAFWALIDGVLVGSVLQLADQSFLAANKLIDPDIPQPTEPNKSGSAASLIDWQDMGEWGRSYVSKTPTPGEIAEFAGDGTMEPIRVYAGLASAETAHARAELALQEMVRVGGFERSVLVVMVPVGTGWMDPGAQDTLEYMLGGDVATVAVQYSYLPSALSIFANPDVGVEQAHELFNLIYDYWTKLPKYNRPKLYVHGLSLGAYNSQMTLPLLDLLGDPIDGAMWAGSPFFSPVWGRIRNDRLPDSPFWRPRYGNGSLARVMNQDGMPKVTTAPWGPIRLVFLSYGSDPIVNFTEASAFHPPAWLNHPRPPDVSPDLRWFPVVTMLQTALDTSISLEVPGFGHYYIAPHYIDAWAELLGMPGWTPAKAEELKAIFAKRPLPM